MASTTAFTGSVPQNYETYLGPLFFEPYAVDLAERITAGTYQTVLELACGTGRVTKHLVNKVAAGGRLHATDLNEDMLRVAQGRITDARIEWSVADAHQLPFGDNTFDLVVCQYGVMFFQEKEKAFAEVYRVLKSSGRFLFNTWDEVKFNAVAHLANETLKEIFPEEPPSFFEKGPYSFYNREVIQQFLEDADFTEINIELVAKTGVAASPDDVVHGIFDGTPVSPFLKEQGERADKARKRFRELLVQQYGEKDLRLPMQAFVCEAVRL